MRTVSRALAVCVAFAALVLATSGARADCVVRTRRGVEVLAQLGGADAGVRVAGGPRVRVRITAAGAVVEVTGAAPATGALVSPLQAARAFTFGVLHVNRGAALTVLRETDGGGLVADVGDARTNHWPVIRAVPVRCRDLGVGVPSLPRESVYDVPLRRARETALTVHERPDAESPGVTVEIEPGPPGLSRAPFYGWGRIFFELVEADGGWTRVRLRNGDGLRPVALEGWVPSDALLTSEEARAVEARARGMAVPGQGP